MFVASCSTTFTDMQTIVLACHLPLLHPLPLDLAWTLQRSKTSDELSMWNCCWRSRESDGCRDLDTSSFLRSSHNRWVHSLAVRCAFRCSTGRLKGFVSCRTYDCLQPAKQAFPHRFVENWVALVPTFTTNLRGNTCNAGYTNNLHVKLRSHACGTNGASPQADIRIRYFQMLPKILYGRVLFWVSFVRFICWRLSAQFGYSFSCSFTSCLCFPNFPNVM